jgi:flagellin
MAHILLHNAEELAPMLTINTNIASLNAQASLAQHQLRVGQSMERLSTGKRINSASDDAAGISIVSRMQAQVLGTAQAIRNTNDGISLAQTADGSMDTLVNILQRMRELTVQSMNGTYSSNDTASIDSELSQLKDEFSRITNSTSWNGATLLNGTGGDGTGNFQFQVGTNGTDNDQIDLTIPDLSTIFATDAAAPNPPPPSPSPPTTTNQDIKLSVTGVDDEYKVLVDGTVVAFPPIGNTPDATIDLSPYVKSTGSTIEAIFSNNSGGGGYSYNLIVNGTSVASQTDSHPDFRIGVLKDMTYTTTPDSTPPSPTPTPAPAQPTSSNITLADIDTALDKVVNAQSVIGATVNRLRFALDLASTTSTNIQASKSQIEDTDYGIETSALAQNQIIVQAATSMLAQANQSTKDILTLIQPNK